MEIGGAGVGAGPRPNSHGRPEDESARDCSGTSLRPTTRRDHHGANVTVTAANRHYNEERKHDRSYALRFDLPDRSWESGRQMGSP